MKDYIKRISISVFFGLFICFLVYNLIQGQPIVIPQYANLNYLFYTLLIGGAAYITIWYGFFPTHIKFSRAILFVLGVATIFLGKTMLTNDGEAGLYFGDIASVFGVVILIIGPTGLIFTQKIHKQKEEKDLEIIEV